MISSSRRSFLKLGALAGSGLLFPLTRVPAQGQGALPAVPAKQGSPGSGASNELLTLCDELVQTWADRLIEFQMKQPELKGLYGGILCPSCSVVHGRCGDAIFPFLYLANHTHNPKYFKAAIQVYEWMEHNVSMPDGSWVNEVSVSDWKGISVFTAITLAEALTCFGHLFDHVTKLAWEARLKAAAEFLYGDFTINTGNINYPATATYALALLGKYFNEPRYVEKGKMFAKAIRNYLTPHDRLLFGEGRPAHEPSESGCYSVDLGYNVEESLPALIMYAQLTGDNDLMDILKISLDAHLQFMLPDGAWDNSWGTRNFKWTYWGSRTSDGCQPAFALMADVNNSYYMAALRNTQLLKACTHEGLLHGGPHMHSHHILPCVHHTFGHSKALTILLTRRTVVNRASKSIKQLPREQEYGVRVFRDIGTWLIAHGGWRATVTANAREYLMRSGHASGGALAMLWHSKAGPILCGSMTIYQLTESANMQRNKDEQSMCLTPRFELQQGTGYYTNIHDLNAEVSYQEEGGELTFKTASKMVNGEQQGPAPDVILCHAEYRFHKDLVNIQVSHNSDKTIKYVLPIIASGEQLVSVISDHELEVKKSARRIRVVSSAPFKIALTHGGRVFNFVPGLEAVPLVFDQHKVSIAITVL